MYAIDLGGGAELRPLEPWQSKEFLAHMDRARASVDPWIPWASRSTDLASATATLQRYADLAAGDAGRICGIWLDGVLRGEYLYHGVRYDTQVWALTAPEWTEQERILP